MVIYDDLFATPLGLPSSVFHNSATSSVRLQCDMNLPFSVSIVFISAPVKLLDADKYLQFWLWNAC